MVSIRSSELAGGERDGDGDLNRASIMEGSSHLLALKVMRVSVCKSSKLNI